MSEAEPQKIIFLDISGVLSSQRYRDAHPENVRGLFIKGVDPVAVERINDLCASHHAHVVIISSYAHDGKTPVESDLRSHGFKGQFAPDWTLNYDSSDQLDELARGPAIAKYCDKHGLQPKDYIIVADIDTQCGEKPDYSPAQQGRHVQPVTREGFVEDDYRKADRLLGNTPSAAEMIRRKTQTINEGRVI